MVVEILLNPDGSLWAEKHGDMLRIGTMTAVNAKHLLGTIAASLDAVINREHPLLEGELLLDGSRVAGTIPPIVENPSVEGHCLVEGVKNFSRDASYQD